MHLPSEFGLIIVLLIVVILFGCGRIAKVSGELGTAIREFRRGLNGGDPQQPEAPPASAIAPDTTTVNPTEKESEEAKG